MQPLNRALAAFGLAVVAAGCGGGSAPAPAETATSETSPPKLSDADKALVEKQKVCLVAGEPLGSMGTPVKLTIKGRDVFLCCEGCREAVEKDPDKYLAKLDANGGVIVEPKEPATDTPPATPDAPADSKEST